MLDKIRAWNQQHRFLVLLIALVVSAGLFTMVTAARSSGATVDETQKRICTSTPNPDLNCNVQRHLRRFKHDRYGHVNGVGHLKLFASAKAKKLVMKKLASHMPKKPFKSERNANCSKAPSFVCPHSRGGTREGHRRCMASELCRAYNHFGETASAITCIGVNQSYDHPNCYPYRLLHPSPMLTWHEVLVGGSVVICGTAVVIGVVTKAGSVAIGMLGSSCAWGFLRDTTDH